MTTPFVWQPPPPEGAHAVGSPTRHARQHALGVGHPIVRSFEPGESWRWCYVDQAYV